MSLFNKIQKNQDKRIQERMESLYNSITRPLEENHATIYETLDLLTVLLKEVSGKLINLSLGDRQKVKELEDKLKQYDSSKSKENTAEENKE